MQKRKPNCCSSIKVAGVHTGWRLARSFSVPSYSLLRADGLDEDALALIEPLAIGAHGIARANVLAGEYVLVIGAGPIGLGTIAFAGIAGAKVIVVDVNEQRLVLPEITWC